MARTIKLQITGRGAESDAPTVQDLLDQVRDYFDIVRGVEEAVAEDGVAEIEWRVIAASKNSPLSIVVAPFARQFAMNVDRRAELVMAHTARGMRQIQERAERPAFFSQKVLAKAEQFFERVTNGLSETDIDYGPGLPRANLTRGTAQTAAGHVQQLLKPPPKAYQEIGSIEGVAHGFDRDGWGYPLLRVRHRMTGDEISCRVSGQALEEIEARRVGEVWRNRRVQLYGTIYFKGLGHISRIEATLVRFLRTRSELPDVDDIQDETFTGGLSSEDYLEAIRNGDAS